MLCRDEYFMHQEQSGSACDECMSKSHPLIEWERKGQLALQGFHYFNILKAWRLPVNFLYVTARRMHYWQQARLVPLAYRLPPIAGAGVHRCF